MDDKRIYEQILGRELRFGKTYQSPFRDDKNPSLSFYQTSSGRIRWKDFGTDEPSGGVYQFVAKHLGTEDLDAIKSYIYDGRETQIFKKQTTQRILPPRKNSLEIKAKRWSEKELDYWQSYHISKETLKMFNTVPLAHFYVNDIKNDRLENELLFAQLVGSHVKIYSPLSKTRKWKSNTTKSDVFGLEQLKFKSDTLILTKSLKDIMTLHELGYEAIAPMSETSDFPKMIEEEVLPRYKNIYVLFDNDTTGLKRGEILSLKYSAANLIIPLKTGCKDVSDIAFKYRGKLHKIVKILTSKLKPDNEKEIRLVNPATTKRY